MLVIGFFDHRKRYLIGRAILRQRDLVCADLPENAQEGPPAINHLAGPNPNPFTDKSREVFRFLKWPVDPRRRNFESVGALNHVPSVEQITELPAHTTQIVDRRSPLLIQVKPQDSSSPASLVPELDINNLHAFNLGQRSRQFPYSRDSRIHRLRLFVLPKNKKSGQSPLRASTLNRSALFTSRSKELQKAMTGAALISRVLKRNKAGEFLSAAC
jgi:hypothetical protein